MLQEDLACAQAVLEELMPLGSLLFRPEEWDTLKKEHAKTRQERSGVAPARSNTRGENQETPANLHRSDTDEVSGNKSQGPRPRYQRTRAQRTKARPVGADKARVLATLAERGSSVNTGSP